MYQNLVNTLSFLALSITALLATTMPMTSVAGDKEDTLIEKITTAYGGDALVNLSSYKIDEKFISPATGQSNSPSLTEIGSTAQVLVVDIKNNKAVYDNWNEGRGGGFQASTITDGENGQTINYATKTYGTAGNADPHVFAGGTMRTSDTVLVYELNKVKDKAKLLADETYMNRPHHTLTMPFPSSADLKLFIDAETFFISRMLRVNPQLGNLDYAYSKHKVENGITYASSMVFSIAGVPNLISTKHALQFNFAPAAELFTLPKGFSSEGDRIDDSQMIVNKISDRVYHIGQNGGFSIFADTSMGIIGAGGYPALDTRLARFQKESGNYKPLAYQVITHHHSDHIAAVSEAISLGARLVTVSDNVATLKASTTPTPQDRDFYKVGAQTTFGEGKNRVDIYEVSTIHAASFLVSYLPTEKTIFIADHMGTPFAKGLPVANSSTVDMLKALDSLDINIQKIATAHSARIFSMQEMRDSVAAYQPNECLANRPVCS